MATCVIKLLIVHTIAQCITVHVNYVNHVALAQVMTFPQTANILMSNVLHNLFKSRKPRWQHELQQRKFASTDALTARTVC